MDRKILSIIDANVNRMGEALRVCEEITRFVLSDRKSTEHFKRLRHRLAKGVKGMGEGRQNLIECRRPSEDIGKRTIKSEAKRRDAADIFNANIKRAQESSRVLEEFGKLFNVRLADTFKRMRFECYELEKDVIKRL